jgi:hypothetical protein
MLHLDGSHCAGSGTIVRFGVPFAALIGQVLEAIRKHCLAKK